MDDDVVPLKVNSSGSLEVPAYPFACGRPLTRKKGECSNCIYYDESEDVRYCRRHAPGQYKQMLDIDIPNGQPFSVFNSRWPVVTDGDWCGEFEPQEKAAS